MYFRGQTGVFITVYLEDKLDTTRLFRGLTGHDVYLFYRTNRNDMFILEDKQDCVFKGQIGHDVFI